MPHFRLTCVAQKRLCLSSLVGNVDSGSVANVTFPGLCGLSVRRDLNIGPNNLMILLQVSKRLPVNSVKMYVCLRV